jgi:uncharacterized membrane protein YbhN (UPF0104 family)
MERTASNRPASRVLRVVAGAALGLAGIAWVTRGTNLPALAASLRPAPAGLWALAVAGLAASYVLRALRIRAELSHYRPVGVFACLELMLLHNAAVNVLPMRGGEAAYPFLVHRRLRVAPADAVASLVWMRIQDVILLALAAVALWPGLPAAVRLAMAAALVLATAAGLRLLRGAATGGGRPSEGRLRRAIRGALESLARAPRHGAAGWLFCAGSWSAKLAALGFLLAALGALPAPAALAGALGGELAAVVPVQPPAGFGTYEAGVWAGASLHGAAGTGLAAPAIVVHVFSIAAALAAAAIAHGAGVLLGGRPSSLRGESRP